MEISEVKQRSNMLNQKIQKIRELNEKIQDPKNIMNIEEEIKNLKKGFNDYKQEVEVQTALINDLVERIRKLEGKD